MIRHCPPDASLGLGVGHIGPWLLSLDGSRQNTLWVAARANLIALLHSATMHGVREGGVDLRLAFPTLDQVTGTGPADVRLPIARGTPSS
jgi:hypothetical protein